MLRRFGLFWLAVPAMALFPAVCANAQPYPAPLQSYYRGAEPPDAYQDRLPPPGYYVDQDDEDAPVMPRTRGGSQFSQAPQGQPGNAGPPPPPGYVAPDSRPVYGHQLDAQPSNGSPPPAASNDPNVIRPPAAIGTGPSVAPPPMQPSETAPAPVSPAAASILPPEDQPEVGTPKDLAPNLKRQLVDYATKEPAGTIVVDTANTYLYLVLGGGKALRYGVRVGREGFTWAGTERVSKMKEWPDWFPPPEMIERQPYLPRIMAGGPGNPLGARAMYLGNTLYRIHGTNQPSTIGHYVSSGCVGMLNEDVEDLYSRVQVGSRVVVLPGKPQDNTVANSGAAPVEPANPMAPPLHPGAAVSGSPPPAR
jgi:lipoprotein-anchoring transpeptidase ErfK/SrfK